MHYIRNNFTKIVLWEDKILITGGRYGKKIQGNSLIIEILKKSSNMIQDDVLAENVHQESGVSKEKIKAYLEKLYSLGFLERDCIKISRRISKSSQVEKITSFNVPTCDRIYALHTCIDSFSRQFESYHHKLDYFIFDDSFMSWNENKREYLKELGRHNQIKILYVGQKEKEQFVKELTKDFDRQKVNFAFLPKQMFDKKQYFMAGANRNVILAYHAGENFFMADDDSRCAGISQSREEKIQFASGRGYVEKQFISHDLLMSKVQNITSDLYKAHEKYLGKTLGQIIGEYGKGEVPLEWMTSQNAVFPNQYDRYWDTRIGLTFHSIVGWPDQAADEALNAAQAHNDINYVLGLKNDYVVEKMSSDVIYTRPHLLTTTLTGMDKCAGEIPFVPIYKNEDVHFSSMLNYINPYGLAAGLKLTLLHDKIETSNQLSNFLNHFYGDFVFSYLFMELLKKIEIELPNKYITDNMRKKLFYDFITNICDTSMQKFIQNILDLGIDLKRLYEEKRACVYEVYQQFHMEQREYQGCLGYGGMLSYENFLNHQEWSLIRTVLLQYADLILEWNAMMEKSKDLRKSEKLPVEVLS